jgi:hypothetical protein
VEKEMEDAQSVVESSGSGVSEPKTRRVRLNHLPKRIVNAADIDHIIQELQTLKAQMNEGEILNLEW